MKNTSNVNALGYKTAPLGLEFSVHQEKLQGAERALSSFSNSFRAFSSLTLTKDWKSLRGIGSDFAQFISLIWVVLSLAAVHLPFVEITQKMLEHSFIILYNHLPIQPLAYNSSPSWRDPCYTSICARFGGRIIGLSDLYCFFKHLWDPCSDR